MDALKQLSKDALQVERLTARRDELIVAARRAGATWPAIAEAAGRTEMAVRNAAKKANGGVLP